MHKNIFFNLNRLCPKFEVGIKKIAFSKILFVRSTNEISFLFIYDVVNFDHEKIQMLPTNVVK